MHYLPFGKVRTSKIFFRQVLYIMAVYLSLGKHKILLYPHPEESVTKGWMDG